MAKTPKSSTTDTDGAPAAAPAAAPAPAPDPNATSAGAITAPVAPAPSMLIRAPNADEQTMLDVLAEAGLGASTDDDGLSEVAPTDLRTPLKLYNLKRADGVARITQDQFLDTVDRAVTNELNLVLLDMHKTNKYEVYNGERNETWCESFDRVTGVWRGQTVYPEGTERPCKGCPDAQWRTVKTEQGQTRRTVPCGEVWNVAAWDLDAQKVVLLRFKKTALDAIRAHVQAHHVNRRMLAGGRRGNIPLYAFRVRVTLAMDKSGNHAVPVIERVAVLPAADIRVMHETAIGVRETFEARMRAADSTAAGVGDDAGGDTSFDVDAMGGGGGGGGGAGGTGTRGSEAFVE